MPPAVGPKLGDPTARMGEQARGGLEPNGSLGAVERGTWPRRAPAPAARSGASSGWAARYCPAGLRAGAISSSSTRSSGVGTHSAA